MNFKKIDQIDFIDKKALIRVDYNVPINSNLEVIDESRILSSLPTINKILKDGGSCILMSHMGRPNGINNPKLSLKNIISSLEKLLNKKVLFCEDCISEKTVEKCNNIKNGEIILLENLRFYKEEELGNTEFAKKLSTLGDVYVNDAFGTSHRIHSSNSIITDFFNQKCIGYLIENEIKNINKILYKKSKPFTAILGGSKVSDKILLIEKLMSYVDNIIIGGAMSNTFIKANNGKIGNSIYESNKIELVKKILEKSVKMNVKIYLPIDFLVSKSIDVNSKTKFFKSGETEKEWINVDIGPNSIKKFDEIIMQSKKILWNGPMGVYEIDKYSAGTNNIANSISNSTKNGSISLIGGGDSVAVVTKQKLKKQISFISSGGGALLSYLTNEKLDSIKNINKLSL
tara:strand:+ start:705 stop:1907 length:1203 start_codon:yes stop_codon:yes gene_type:complete